ncbi:multidrug transporter subunit MdtD [Diaphorobacter caeni]|uniref:multidrug transporter subunit MdtD n=1 Tax=Diaphorobacter caeni TaxID=2784387 RepID=UPI00189037EB|nr:multidrug transporter subunit MdtD [Diaphorobacter caeni]MBF5007414.1 multidrug transporter subunit MdtD [Diaphorobacter caeni]
MTSTPAAELSPVKNKLLWLVSLGFFMQTLDGTIVNTALPAMAEELGESPLQMHSVIVAYSLAMAVLIPASGWLADKFGTRRVFMSAIALFVLGSVLCALSPNLQLLVASRVVQGLGGALLLPVGRLAVLRAFPREQFIRAISFVAIPGLVGPLIGPTLGGWMVEFASWHWIFWVNVPVGLIGLVAASKYMPVGEKMPPRGFDLLGYLMLAAGMALVSLAVEGMASGGGVRGASALIMLVFGLACLCGYWLHALRKPEPLFAPELFTVRTLRVGLLGNLFSRLGSSAMPFMMPLVLQVSLGYSPMHAGMMMLPTVIGSMAMKRFVTRVIFHFGYREVLVTNTWLLALLIASFAFISPDVPTPVLIAQLLVFGAINSLQFSAMNTVTLKDLLPHFASSGNSLLSMVQMLSMGMGVAIAGAVLAGFQAHLGSAAAGDTLWAFRGTFIVMGLLTLAATVLFMQLPDKEQPNSQPSGPESHN